MKGCACVWDNSCQVIISVCLTMFEACYVCVTCPRYISSCACVCVTGYKCEIHNNPPDFFLDVISGDTTPVHSDMFGHSKSGEP